MSVTKHQFQAWFYRYAHHTPSPNAQHGSCSSDENENGWFGLLKQRNLTYREGAYRNEMSCGDREHKSGQVGCLKQRHLTCQGQKMDTGCCFALVVTVQ